METRENRIITIAEDYGEVVLCITNLDNEALKNIIVQTYNDIEEGIGRPASAIVEQWIDAEMLPRDAYVKELAGTDTSDIIEIKDLDTKCIAFFNYLTVNVVSGREQELKYE